MNKHTRL